MLSSFRIVACLAVSSFGAEAAFQTQSVSSAKLSAREAARYERLKKAPGVQQVKLVEMNEASLARSAVQLELFDGARSDFSVSRDAREAVWKGKNGKTLDRFVIRRVGGKYSGQILHKGRQYALTPVKGVISALYEVDRVFECGMESLGAGDEN